MPFRIARSCYNIYINRKNKHSINIQLICNANYKIINAVAQWPGSTHDSRIIRECHSGWFSTSLQFNTMLPLANLTNQVLPVQHQIATSINQHRLDQWKTDHPIGQSYYSLIIIFLFLLFSIFFLITSNTSSKGKYFSLYFYRKKRKNIHYTLNESLSISGMWKTKCLYFKRAWYHLFPFYKDNKFIL